MVAVALVARLTAFLQLGYHADVTSAGTDRPVVEGQSYLERATHEASRAVRGAYDWHERGLAVTAVRNRLQIRLRTLERSRVSAGVAYQSEFNQTIADRWARTNCPSGPDRAFGSCEAERGVVVQERDGRTLVLVVGYDLRVTTENGDTRVATAINATS